MNPNKPLMRKLYLALAGLFCLGTVSAQTILSEDFETGNTGDTPQPVAAGSGWTTVNGYTGESAHYNWYNYYSNPEGTGGPTITGNCCAACDAPIMTDADGAGPREEVLLSPELNLNDDYQLSFNFRVSPMNAYDYSKYDLQVRVVIDGDLSGAETIFSIQNEKMLRESGVLSYPISNWDIYNAKVGLEDFKDEKVQLAFVYKMYTDVANIVWLDDITVSKYTPATGPVPSVSLNRINFGNVYVGEKFYSDLITLTNTGKDGLQITGIDYPEGVSSTLDAASVNLNAYGHVDFNLSYTAALASAASGNVVIHTNGGDVTIAITASKQFVPDGYTLETFEQYFPPAGWASTGWVWSTNVLEGDHSVYCSGDYSASYLRSPRLDLSEGGSVTFTYYNSFDDEEDAPQYDIELQVSEDGGNSWESVWVSDYENGLNQLLTETVDLGERTDNCYVRWYYPAVETDDEGAYPHSSFLMDRVLLPHVYGADGVPTAASSPSPANNAKEVYPRDVVLSWAPAQFAKGYKVYVGTNAGANDLVDGVDVGNALTYTVPQCDYETLYRWKVVGYNDAGNGDSTTWKFTTQPDASVTEYPYEQDFLEDGLPTGWSEVASATYSRVWSVNSLYPYKNDTESYGVFYSPWLEAGESSSVTTQEFQIPSDDNMQISFIWGDGHPSDLVVDTTGLVKKENVEPNNGYTDVVFSIYADGAWKDVSHISREAYDEDGHKYWINEKYDLSEYKGKRVQFRWTHYSYNRNKDAGASLTHIVLERILGDKAKFNVATWDAGKVNYEKSVNSGTIFTLLNEGVNDLTIKSATFSTPNFSSTLKAGDVIKADNGLQFSCQFDALQTQDAVEDDLTIEFESGYKTSFPVSGEALHEGTYYYSFEPNDLDLQWTDDFTMIDADNAAGFTFSSYWVHYSKDGQKCAFSAESDSYEDGMYGMMGPVSGNWALVASSPQESCADNWIISKKVKATSISTFEFYARNWECLESVLPAANHHVTVLVSTTSNTDTKAFETVMKDTEMPLLSGKAWNHYVVDLSKYDGQDIYVALRHTTTEASNLAFFDDFTLRHFDIAVEEGVKDLAASDDAAVEVYTISGNLAARGTGMGVLRSLAKGFYIVRITENGVTRSLRIAK
jgi:hypothetical protein